MAIRLQGGFTSTQTNSVYVINIHDSAYVGSIIDFDVLKDGVIKGYDHHEKGRNLSVMTSKLKVKMLVKNQDIKDFLTDVVEAAEGQFLIEVLKDGSKDWYGYILPDLLDLQDILFSLNPVLTISATDGIGRLKTIDYNNGGAAYTGFENFIEHIFNILGKIGFDSFYAAAEDYLITYVDWWDTNQIYLNTDNPFELARFNHKALINVDNGGETVYRSAYDVLEHLVKTWNCRFLFSEGAYHLVQVNAYETDAATKVLKKYDKNQTKTTTSTTDFDIWNYTTGSLSGYSASTFDSYHNKGRFRYYPALRKVEVEYSHFSTDNLIPGITWNDSQSPTVTYSEVDDNSGTTRLFFSTIVESRVDYTTDIDFQVIAFWFRLTLKVGSKYLKRPFTVNSSGQIIEGKMTWEDSLSYVDMFSEYTRFDNIAVIKALEFITPVVQATGDLEVNITRRIISYNAAGQQVNDAGTWTPYYTFINTSINVLVAGNIEDQTNIRLYTATNDDGSTNSEVEKIPVLVGDGPSPNTFGHIEIYNGTGWEDSSGWRKGNTGSYIAFGQLLANEVLAGQKYAVERYIGTVTGSFEPHGRLQRDNGVTVVSYVFIGGSHNLHRDLWTGEWFKIDIDESGITEEAVKDFIDFSEFVRGGERPPRTPNRPGFTPTGNNEPGVLTHGEGENGPVQIQIDGGIPKDIPISTIPVDEIQTDDGIKDGDPIIIVTPTGETIEATADGDVNAGDTTIDIDPITPGVDIPEGSIIVIPLSDVLSYVQKSRTQQIEFLSDIRVTDPITAGAVLYFLRIDPNSRFYANRIKTLELQVHTPGVGSGTYDYILKKDGTSISTTNVSETTVIDRASLSHVFTSGLYTLHIDNITGSLPWGVNFIIGFVDSLQTFAAPTITIAFTPVTTVYEVGTSNAITISGATTNPANLTLSNGELNRILPTPVTSINSFGASATYSQGITFTPQQGGTGNYNELSYTFQAAQDYTGTESGSITSPEKQIKGVYPILYGMSATDLSTSGDLYTTLSKLVEDEDDKTVTLNGTGFIYYAIPKTWTDFDLSQILDHNGFDVTAAFTAYDRTVSSSGLTNDWTNENYKLYKINVSTQTSNYDYQFIR